GPVAELAAVAEIEIVVVAVEAGLGIVADVNVVTVLLVEDVPDQFGIVGAADNLHGVAVPGIDGVVADANIMRVRHADRDPGVAGKGIVQDLLVVGRVDADRVAIDLVELHRADELRNTGRVAFDDIRVRERRVADRAGAGHTDDVAGDE